MKQKNYYIISFFVIATFISLALEAQEVKKNNIKDANSASEMTPKMIEKLSQDKSVEATNTLIKEVYKKEHSIEAKIQVIYALSEREDKKSQDNVLKALSDVILTSKDHVLIYSAILAIGRIGNYKNIDVMKAISYCLKNKMSDIYIADIVDKIKSNFAKGKLEDFMK